MPWGLRYSSHSISYMVTSPFYFESPVFGTLSPRAVGEGRFPSLVLLPAILMQDGPSIGLRCWFCSSGSQINFPLRSRARGSVNWLFLCCLPDAECLHEAEGQNIRLSWSEVRAERLHFIQHDDTVALSV